MKTPLQMSSAMCQKHMRLWHQTMADVSGCFILPYCHTESLSLRLPNDTWAAVYFCLHLYAQDPTLHIKSSCLQKEKMFILKNASHIRCLGKAFLRGMESKRGPFSEVMGGISLQLVWTRIQEGFFTELESYSD